MKMLDHINFPQIDNYWINRCRTINGFYRDGHISKEQRNQILDQFADFWIKEEQSAIRAIAESIIPLT